MKDIILVDGKNRYNYNDLLNLYGSEEQILINIYNWEKNKLIEFRNDRYERLV